MDIVLTALAVQLVNLVFIAWFKRTALFRTIALRHQIMVLRRKVTRPILKNRDRLLWKILTRLWPKRGEGWRQHLVIVTPDTVLRWQHRRLRDFLRLRSQGLPGRPRIPRSHINLIKHISRDHPEYGVARIALELKLKLGVEHAESTIDRYRVPAPRSPDDSQRWRTFLKNNADAIWAADFLTQYTVGFRALHVFVVMHLASRKVVHFAITEHPTLAWIKQQVRYATFDGVRPKFLIHDNDGRYGQLGHTVRLFNESKGKAHSCRSTLAAWLWQTMDIRSVPTPYGAPNAAAHIERLIGTVRRECLDHLLIWNERQLHCVLTEYFRWYNQARVHQGIHGIPDPDPALAEPKPAVEVGHLVAHPILGGLHHDYRLVA
jgi:hypothetical protein